MKNCELNLYRVVQIIFFSNTGKNQRAPLVKMSIKLTSVEKDSNFIYTYYSFFYIFNFHQSQLYTFVLFLINLTFHSSAVTKINRISLSSDVMTRAEDRAAIELAKLGIFNLYVTHLQKISILSLFSYLTLLSIEHTGALTFLKEKLLLPRFVDTLNVSVMTN